MIKSSYIKNYSDFFWRSPNRVGIIGTLVCWTRALWTAIFLIVNSSVKLITGIYSSTCCSSSEFASLLERHTERFEFFFWCGSILFYGFSEPLGINFEGLESLLSRKGLFVEIYFDSLWYRTEYDIPILHCVLRCK